MYNQPFCWFCFLPENSTSTNNTVASLEVTVLKSELLKQPQNLNISPQMRKSRYLREDMAQIIQTSLRANEKYRGLWQSAFKICKDVKKLGKIKITFCLQDLERFSHKYKLLVIIYSFICGLLCSFTLSAAKQGFTETLPFQLQGSLVPVHHEERLPLAGMSCCATAV